MRMSFRAVAHVDTLQSFHRGVEMSYDHVHRGVQVVCFHRRFLDDRIQLLFSFHYSFFSYVALSCSCFVVTQLQSETTAYLGQHGSIVRAREEQWFVGTYLRVEGVLHLSMMIRSNDVFCSITFFRRLYGPFYKYPCQGFRFCGFHAF